MFESARVRLTAWYLLILMSVSIFFSALIFFGVSRELEQGFRRTQLRLHAERMGLHLPRQFSTQLEDLSPQLREAATLPFLAEDLEEARKALLLRLFTLNGMIFVVSAAASYIMAGRTLAPLEKALEEQKRFVADASHELRTPLTALRTSIEVALREKLLTTRQARDILSDSLDDVGRLSNLSTKLLHLSRLQQEMPLNISAVDLSEAVSGALKHVKPIAKKKNVGIKTDVPSSILDADAGQLEEMLVIFLDNGVKYTPKGGKVNLRSKTTKKHLTITISDTGIGIEKKHLPHIFDRFYRVESSRMKGESDGFGLGLSLAKQIIKAHQGSVEVESRLNKGTTFTIKLPLNQP